VINKTTFAKNFYPGTVIPLGYEEKSGIPEVMPGSGYFSMIFIPRGNGIVKLGVSPVSFLAPVLFCLNEKSHLMPVNCSDVFCQSVTFDPSYLNDLLKMENFYDTEFKPSGTLINDMWLLKRIFFDDPSKYACMNVNPQTYERIKMLFDNIKDQYVNQFDPFWPCRGRSYFIELLVLVERLPDMGDTITIKEFNPSRELEDIYPVILFINNSYGDRITIEGLSRRFSTNRTTLNEKFMKATGASPINYLIKLRIQVAKILLQDTSIPISEIVERTGFDDTTHFGRMFKKYTGVNPSSFRNNFKLPSYMKI
jgi:YesN/AraC family two-component response regulator